MLLIQITLGIIIFQMTLVWLQWFFFKRSEFLWYILYLFTIFSYLYIYNEKGLGLTHCFYPYYLLQFNTLRVIGFVTLASYVIFGRSFIDLNSLYPEMKRTVNSLLYTIWICTIVYIVFALFTQNILFLENLSFVIYAIAFLYSAVMNLILIYKKITLNNFIIVGSIFAIVGGSIQGILETINIRKGQPMFIATQTLPLGCLLEFVCLNIGFLYKSKMIQRDEIAAKETAIRLLKEKEEIAERLQNIQKEYSMDLHDEIGSTLSSISIYNQLVQQTIHNDIEKTTSLSKKIQEYVEDMMSITEEIVWGLKAKAQHKQGMTYRVENFAQNFLLPKSITWSIHIDVALEQAVSNTIVERNLLLIIKEALNNCAKYSQATRATIRMYKNEAHCFLQIEDDGIGIQLKGNMSGNGLQNMQHRCERLGGKFNIDTNTEKGTRINCIFPMAIFS